MRRACGLGAAATIDGGRATRSRSLNRVGSCRCWAMGWQLPYRSRGFISFASPRAGAGSTSRSRTSPGAYLHDLLRRRQVRGDCYDSSSCLSWLVQQVPTAGPVSASWSLQRQDLRRQGLSLDLEPGEGDPGGKRLTVVVPKIPDDVVRAARL